jgi:hypothetical protein
MVASELVARWPDVVPDFDSDGLAQSYDAMGQNIASMRETTHNYYAWMATALRPWLGKRTMEVGAGWGAITGHLRNLDYYLITETWEPFLRELRDNTRSRWEADVRNLDIKELPDRRDELRALNLDSIFSTNLLEHLKDDVGTMRDMAGAVRPGGRVVNLVPAYRKLYGENDRVIGHYRRYEPDELRTKMEAAGLTVEKVFTFNQAGVFAWLATSKILRRTNASGGQYASFDRMVPMFKAWEKIVPLPVGLSLIGVGRT